MRLRPAVLVCVLLGHLGLGVPPATAVSSSLVISSLQHASSGSATQEYIGLANTGSTALKLGDLFTPQTAFWSVAGSVVQPIFHGGTLAQRELAARAAYDQAAAQYRSTVVMAFQNVADVLSALQNDAVALQKTIATERAASRSLEIMRRRLGYEEDSSHVLQEIGAAMRISRERVRQIEMQALRKLKFAAKRRGLFTYIAD